MNPKVFLCQPGRLNSHQRRISGQWHSYVSSLGFSVEQLCRESYRNDPVPDLLRFIRSCDGVLVLGFRQLTVESGSWRPGTDEESNVAVTWTSPWLHTEIGMALAAQLPVLVAAESGVKEGVFDSGIWKEPLLGTSAETPDGHILKRWAAWVAGSGRQVAHNRIPSAAGTKSLAMTAGPGP